MPTVPVLERSVQAQGFRPQQIQLPSGYGNVVEPTGMRDLANSFEGMARKAKERGDTVALIEAQRRLDDWEASNLFDPTNGALNKKGKDAFDLPNKLGADFDKYSQSILDSLSNDDQKIAFEKMRMSRADNMKRTLFSHERSQMDSYAKSNNQALLDSSAQRAALYYNVPDVVNQAITDARFAARSQGMMEGMSEEALSMKELEAESQVRMGQLTRLADTNPQQAVEYYKTYGHRLSSGDLLRAQSMMAPVERQYKARDVAQKVVSKYQSKQSPSEMIQYVMTDIEGGDKVVIDNDGGTAKFGINHKHNGMTPEQVAALTPEQAAAHYKTHYWDKMNIDALPADMRMIAFDAAVNHGADDHTRQMIEQANGDPRRLLEIRRDYYIQLARQNPTQNGPAFEGWMNRLNKLSAQLDMMRGQPVNLAEINQEIDSSTDDIEVATDAKKLIKDMQDARNAQVKATQDAASDEAYTYLVNNQPVPPSVEARMKPEEILKMRKMQNDGMEPDPIEYNRIRNLALTGQPIMGDDGQPMSQQSLRWALGNKYNEIAGIMSDPSKLVNARSIDDIINSANGRIIGKSQPQSTADYKKIEEFRQQIQMQIDGIQRATGKAATPDDIQKIADRMLISVSASAFSKNSDADKLYQVVDQSNFKVSGIPAGRTHVLMTDKGPQEIEYGDLVNDIVSILQYRGLPLTKENLEATYKRAIESGRLSAKYQR